jgi:hypothetical protein
VHRPFALILYKRRGVDVPVGTRMASTGPSEAERLAGNLFAKISQVHDLLKVVDGKIEDGAFDLVLTTRDIMTVVDKIDKKIDQLDTKIENDHLVMHVRFNGLDNGEGVLHDELRRLRDDVAVLAYLVEQMKQLLRILSGVVLLMVLILVVIVPLVPLEQKYETLVECSKPGVVVVVDGMTQVWNITKNLNGAALRIACNFFFQFNE